MPWRNITITLFAITLTVGTAMTALWATAPHWVLPLLQQQLAQRGWQLDAVDLQRPGWRALTINHLELTLPGAARDIVIRGDAIALHYHLLQLLRGRIERIDSARLEIDVRPHTNTTPNDEPLTLSALLPSNMFARLPFAAAHIDNLQLHIPLPTLAQLQGDLDYHAQQLTLQLHGAEAAGLTLHLRADQRNQVELRLRDASRDMIALNNRFTAAATTTTLQGQARIDLDALQTLLPTTAAQLTGKFEADWHGELPNAIDSEWQQQLTLDGTIKADGSAATPSLPRTTIKATSQFQFAAGTLRGNIDAGTITLQFPAPAALAKLYALKPGHHLPITAQIDSNTRYQIDFAQQQLTFDPVRIDAQIRDKTAGIDTTATIDQLSVHYGTPLAATVHMTVTTPELPAGNMRLRPAQVETTLQLADNQLDGKWQWLDVAKVYRFDGTISYRLDTQRGELQAQSQPMLFRENGNYLPAIFKGWSYPFDFSSGQLTLGGQLRWDTKTMQGDTTLHTKQLGGFYNRQLFRGADTKLHAVYRSNDRKGIFTLQPQPITIAEVTAGIPVRNISATLSANTDSVQLQNFTADLFGGKITQPSINYSLSGTENRFTLQLQQLQLAQILALQQGVEGTGVIDGSVPIRLSTTGVSIDGAQLQARPPGGVLRYHGSTPASAVQNPGLAIALKSLENFHYDSMSIRADFALDSSKGSATARSTALSTADSTNGDLLLAVALKGRNPTAPDTPPVNFNLNIRENIPDLLRTLQIGDDISARIEKRIQTLQQKPPRTQPVPRKKNEKGAVNHE